MHDFFLSGYFPKSSSTQVRCREFRALAKEKYERFWKDAGAKIMPEFILLEEKYTHPARHYHNEIHVLECLAFLMKSLDLAERFYEVGLAIFYHDVIYEPGSKNNEWHSSEVFKRLAGEVGIRGGSTDRISNMILSTSSHVGRTPDEVLLNDIDLAILGADGYVYSKYEENIRKEFFGVTDECYFEGRKCVLEGFLSEPKIFKTPKFWRLLEDQARHNLRSRLSQLHKARQ